MGMEDSSISLIATCTIFMYLIASNITNLIIEIKKKNKKKLVFNHL